VVTDFAIRLHCDSTSFAIAKRAKYVLLGGGGDVFALARYNRDGSLEATFGSGGKVTTDFGANGQGVGNAVAVQPDGRIVIAGESSAGPSEDFTLTRYLP
jgi:uncharacterized delta-60 repeat protein